MLAAIPVVTHLWNEVFAHWWNYYFWGSQPPVAKNVWYERAVWGNVFADLPLALLGVGLIVWGIVWHKGVLAELHEHINRQAAQIDAHHSAAGDRHDKLLTHLKKLVDMADPEQEGKIADVLDRLTLETPGGIADVVAALKPGPITVHTSIDSKQIAQALASEELGGET